MDQRDIRSDPVWAWHFLCLTMSRRGLEGTPLHWLQAASFLVGSNTTTSLEDLALHDCQTAPELEEISRCNYSKGQIPRSFWNSAQLPLQFYKVGCRNLAE
ncbi:hypothetical protein Y1Q_0021753 [Alligator mississippiensis]|uniref:Uncharacterized protein n=1 Tax=Alligator mississippiensis TaxID=8496 RepID=A0A151PB51_ALLMI|nr:hypothetical protein Y1Q_0021753 [Alligator mississippiensis]